MPMTAISRCSQCDAVVNVHWPSCLVCQSILPPVPKAPVPSRLTPGHPQRVETPIAPILPGWLVTYHDKAGKPCGGSEDRAHGTVRACRWNGGRWNVCLTDGQELPLSFIRAVGKTDKEGRVLSAWTTREHGYDGRKREDTP